MILLERAYTDMGTFGVWTMPSGFQCYTVERPWAGNKPFKSCIPEGVYTMKKRPSPVVERTSRGRYSEGWEVTNVPERSYIMVHPGNTAADLEGCVAPGEALGYIEGKWAVTNSQAVFRRLMTELSTRSEWTIDIRVRAVQWP
jgi:hypothetical protein